MGFEITVLAPWWSGHIKVLWPYRYFASFIFIICQYAIREPWHQISKFSHKILAPSSINSYYIIGTVTAAIFISFSQLYWRSQLWSFLSKAVEKIGKFVAYFISVKGDIFPGNQPLNNIPDRLPKLSYLDDQNVYVTFREIIEMNSKLDPNARQPLKVLVKK